ncbi:Cyclophilin type peptidyl-prolyl cis-trans isomerase/CLD [Babesia microti strain RI]|uniref:Peptidyl-prolyl cis-trans isomerase n=1 Tax=Babesia microti (strain RI) TaxID=1133968 RepID=I7J5G7_BABMR|nr:Cyclophilin type peptidyl-prolyl cis-trans isomerase/CLD [Babesia microti strain RI]CCF72862.1 Cyclophilin type peptidyl-prolyl cis-trans isomerase/CLD [Babesia microti strain RI]|eukprot:XP_012647471.1 Cyclophilin type peptidyl-prolyl cis-trans isomerase/CLD [Babesia microti strain RI]
MGCRSVVFSIAVQFFLFKIALAHHHSDNTQHITNSVTVKVSSDGENIGEFKLGLYGKLLPKTVENFLAFCKGTKINGTYYSYKNNAFHRIIPNFMIQGGDIVNGDGTGSVSIHGKKFDDENFTIKHQPFVIAMANSGPNTNGSQFYITTTHTPWLDGKHVVFGEVTAGKEVIQKIESAGSNSGRPTKKIVITAISLH